MLALEHKEIHFASRDENSTHAISCGHISVEFPTVRAQVFLCMRRFTNLSGSYSNFLVCLVCRNSLLFVNITSSKMSWFK